MKEIELSGKTIEEIYEKLRSNIDNKICQYVCDIKYIGKIITIEIKSREEIAIVYRLDGDTINCNFNYYPFDSKYPSLFLCMDEDEVSETFEEKMRRKQEEMFMKKCY